MTGFLVLSVLTYLAVQGQAQVASPAIPPNVLQEQVGLSEKASPCEKAVSTKPYRETSRY
jgi:hypothetical protein